MDIKHENKLGSGAFFIEERGQRLGELTYSETSNSLITLEHTEVSDILRGKGAGKQLVSAAVDHARKNKLKVNVHCSFAKSVFERVKEFQDVLQS